MSGIPATEIAAAGRALLRLVPEEGPLPTPCWIWPGALTKSGGYGRIHCGPRRTTVVHQLLYRILVGAVPDGLELHHECETPLCANPAHLRPVTHRENLLLGRGFIARKAQQTECVNGHAFDAANTCIIGDGTRRCRTCHRDNERDRQARRRAAAVRVAA